jgi:hypothetical protein
LQLPALQAVVAAQQVGGDAVQPGARVRPARVVAGAVREGFGEGLRRQIVGQRRADAPAQVAMDGVEMALEDLAEALRLLARGADQVRVGRGVAVRSRPPLVSGVVVRGSVCSCPNTANQFTRGGRAVWSIARRGRAVVER